MLRMKLDSCLTPYTEINAKWIRHLSVKAKTIKLLNENIGMNFCNLGLEKLKLDYIKIKNFCLSKDILKWKDKLQSGKCDSPSIHPTKQISTIFEEFLQVNDSINNPTEKWESMTWHFMEITYYMTRCPYHQLSRKRKSRPQYNIMSQTKL